MREQVWQETPSGRGLGAMGRGLARCGGGAKYLRGGVEQESTIAARSGRCQSGRLGPPAKRLWG
jgi:hypothetical protein